MITAKKANENVKKFEKMDFENLKIAEKIIVCKIKNASKQGERSIQYRGFPISFKDYENISDITKEIMQRFIDNGFTVIFKTKPMSIAVDMYIEISW